jgi:hypothetical protein
MSCDRSIYLFSSHREECRGDTVHLSLKVALLVATILHSRAARASQSVCTLDFRFLAVGQLTQAVDCFTPMRKASWLFELVGDFVSTTRRIVVDSHS